MNPFEKRRLGRTSVELTQLGFGAAPIGELFTKVSEEDALATLAASWDAGVRYYDTAPWYGLGLSEHRVGSFLYQQPRNEFVLSTKVGRVLKAPRVKEGFKPPFWTGGLPFDHVYDYTYDGILRSFEDSLQRLRLNRVDLLVIHDLDFGHHETELRVQSYLDQLSTSGWKALEELLSSGEIRGIGAGINELAMIPRFLERFDLDFFVLARHYTLLEQESLESELPLCQEREVGIVLAADFNSGILVTGAVEGAKHMYRDAPAEVLEKVSQIDRVCRSHGVPMPAAALQFPLAHPSVASVIPGVLHPDQVEENLAYFRQPIPPGLWTDLKSQGLIREDAPTP